MQYRPAQFSDLANMRSAMAAIRQRMTGNTPNKEYAKASVDMGLALLQHRPFLQTVEESLEITDEAQQVLQDALVMCKTLFGDSDALTARCAGELGQLYFSTHAYAEACMYFSQAYPILVSQQQYEQLVVVSGIYGYRLYP